MSLIKISESECNSVPEENQNWRSEDEEKKPQDLEPKSKHEESDNSVQEFSYECKEYTRDSLVPAISRIIIQLKNLKHSYPQAILLILHNGLIWKKLLKSISEGRHLSFFTDRLPCIQSTEDLDSLSPPKEVQRRLECGHILYREKLIDYLKSINSLKCPIESCNYIISYDLFCVMVPALADSYVSRLLKHFKPEANLYECKQIGCGKLAFFNNAIPPNLLSKRSDFRCKRCSNTKPAEFTQKYMPSTTHEHMAEEKLTSLIIFEDSSLVFHFTYIIKKLGEELGILETKAVNLVLQYGLDYKNLKQLIFDDKVRNIYEESDSVPSNSLLGQITTDKIELSCGHEFFRSEFIEQLTHSDSLKCMNTECNYIIPYEIFYDLVPDLACSYASRVKKYFNPKSSNTLICPSAFCSRLIYFGKSLRSVICKCGKYICIKCKESAHFPLPCDLNELWQGVCNYIKNYEHKDYITKVPKNFHSFDCGYKLYHLCLPFELQCCCKYTYCALCQLSKLECICMPYFNFAIQKLIDTFYLLYSQDFLRAKLAYESFNAIENTIRHQDVLQMSRKDNRVINIYRLYLDIYTAIRYCQALRFFLIDIDSDSMFNIAYNEIYMSYYPILLSAFYEGMRRFKRKEDVNDIVNQLYNVSFNILNLHQYQLKELENAIPSAIEREKLIRDVVKQKDLAVIRYYEESEEMQCEYQLQQEEIKIEEESEEMQCGSQLQQEEFKLEEESEEMQCESQLQQEEFKLEEESEVKFQEN